MSSVERTSNTPAAAFLLTCNQCGITADTVRKCAGCFQVAYCGKECQKAAWPAHKPVCKAVKKDDQKESNLSLTQLWKRIEAEKATWKTVIDPMFQQLQAMMKKTTHEKVTPLISEFFHDNRPGKLALDLCCGQGFSSIHLLERGWKVIALDQSPESLTYFRRQIDQAHPQWLSEGLLTMTQENVEDFQCDKHPDLVLVADGFPYLDPQKVQMLWKRIFDALPNGGCFVGSFFRRGNFESSAALQMNGAWLVDSLEFVQDLLRTSGYTIEVCRFRPKPQMRSNIIEFLARKPV